MIMGNQYYKNYVMIVIFVSILALTSRYVSSEPNSPINSTGLIATQHIPINMSIDGDEVIVPRGEDSSIIIYARNDMYSTVVHNVSLKTLNFTFKVTSISPKIIYEFKPGQTAMQERRHIN